jgi:hypothetical protein
MRALGEIDQILLLHSQHTLEYEFALQLAQFIPFILCFSIFVISTISCRF